MIDAAHVADSATAPSLPDRVDTVVVGAGITGLAAAHYLERDGASVAVLEAGDRAGGKVRTGSIAGVPVEHGPEGFLDRGPNLATLCRELGLGDRLVEAAASRAAIWVGGRPRPLPDGLLLGAPSRPAALVASRVLSVRGALRAALDLVLPATPVSEQTTVAEAVERRFGREARRRLVDPLVGGIYAGDTTQLGLAAALPRCTRRHPEAAVCSPGCAGAPRLGDRASRPFPAGCSS